MPEFKYMARLFFAVARKLFRKGRGTWEGEGMPLKWRPPRVRTYVRTYLEQLYRPKRFDLSALIIRVAIEIRERFEGRRVGYE